LLTVFMFDRAPKWIVSNTQFVASSLSARLVIIIDTVEFDKAAGDG